MVKSHAHVHVDDALIFCVVKRVVRVWHILRETTFQGRRVEVVLNAVREDHRNEIVTGESDVGFLFGAVALVVAL